MTDKKRIANAGPKIIDKDEYEGEQKLLNKELAKLKDLEVLTEDGGWTSETIDWNLGDYDISLGMKKIFYIRNPNKVLTATLRAMEFSDPTWIFHGPKNNEILPLQTVKVRMEIPAIKEELADKEFERIKQENTKLKLNGRIEWAVRPTILNFEKELQKKSEDGELNNG